MLGSSMLKSALSGKQLESVFEGMLGQMPKPFCLIGNVYVHINAIIWYESTTRKLVLDGKVIDVAEEYATFLEAWLTKLSHQLHNEDVSLDFVPKQLVKIDTLFINVAKINCVVDETDWDADKDGRSPKVVIHYNKKTTELHNSMAEKFIHFMDSRMADVDWEEG